MLAVCVLICRTCDVMICRDMHMMCRHGRKAERICGYDNYKEDFLLMNDLLNYLMNDLMNASALDLVIPTLLVARCIVRHLIMAAFIRSET